jgi:hypothetical protein
MLGALSHFSNFFRLRGERLFIAEKAARVGTFSKPIWYSSPISPSG